MARPLSNRRIIQSPRCTRFGPLVSGADLPEDVLTVDELEALRLADLEGLYQEEAAEWMDISRPTFGRVIEAARWKVARALVEGRRLRIEGGPVRMAETRAFQCHACGHLWARPYGTHRLGSCPECRSDNIQRTDRPPVPRRPGHRYGGARRRGGT